MSGLWSHCNVSGLWSHCDVSVCVVVLQIKFHRCFASCCAWSSVSQLPADVPHWVSVSLCLPADVPHWVSVSLCLPADVPHWVSVSLCLPADVLHWVSVSLCLPAVCNSDVNKTDVCSKSVKYILS